jgi:hypothetical protein
MSVGWVCVRTTVGGRRYGLCRRDRPRHLAPEAEIDHAPGGEPEDLGQPAGELPLVLRLRYRRRAGPWVAMAFWVLAMAGAVLLIARRGLVEASGGDCSD